MGVLRADMFVNPTMSEKYMVTLSCNSASIVMPDFNFSAIVLQKCQRIQIIY